MKILLIQPPNQTESMTELYPEGYAKKARSIMPPLGLLYLASYLKTKHEVIVQDMILNNQGITDIGKMLNEIKPDVVGITSIIGLWPSVLKLLKEIKKIDSSITTIVGGPNATYFPEETLSHKEIDYMIIGNGQLPLMQLCDKLQKKEKGYEIVNCFIQGNEYSNFTVVYNDENNLNNFPLPDRTFTPYMKYTVPFCPENPSTTMITSMGCPHRCEFCTTLRPPLMLLSTEKIVEEMEEIYNLGIKSILFQDELFTINKKRVNDICEQIISRNIKLHWSMKSRIDSIHPEMPELMKKAGCFNIHFGIESGNDKTLLRMKKGYTQEKIKQTIDLVKQAGLSVSGNFMLAYPGETREDILQTIEFAKNLDLNVSQFSLTIDSPGSGLFEDAIRCGRRTHNYLSEYIRHPDPDNSGLPTSLFSASDKFSQEELHYFLELAYASTKTLFDVS